MPRRTTVLASGQAYHVFNQAIDAKPVFSTKHELERAIVNLWYYRFKSPQLPLSKYLSLTGEKRIDYHNLLVESPQIVDVYCYCLMSNHFHFLVKQVDNGGVSRFLSNFQNSYTRHYNIQSKRKGALFLNQFKAIRIETDEQLVHVSRYIHLNPITGYLVKNVNDLATYEWSSFPEYLGRDDITYQVCDVDEILGLFRGKEDYKNFVYNQVDYQRELATIKHLMFES